MKLRELSIYFKKKSFCCLVFFLTLYFKVFISLFAGLYPTAFIVCVFFFSPSFIEV